MIYLRNPENTNLALEMQPHQWPFVLDMTTEELFGSGGWGSGKSYALLQKAGILMAWNPPGTKGIITLPTGPLLTKFIRNYFLPSFGELVLKFRRTELMAEMPEGREIYFLSAFEWQRIQLLTAAWAAGDEIGLWDEEAYTHIVGRVRDERATFPQKAFTGVYYYRRWLMDKFEKDAPNRKRYALKTTDNKRVRPGYVDSILASCPARQTKCYIEGEPVPEGDIVYPEFNRAVHVIPWSYQPFVRDQAGRNLQVEVGLTMDWGSINPHVIVVAHIPKGVQMPGGWYTERETSVVVDEFYPQGRPKGGVTVRHLCAIAQARRTKQAKPYPYSWVVADPEGNTPEATSGETEIMQAEKFLNLRILYLYGQRIKVGVQHVKLALEPLIGRPYLYFSQDLLDNTVEPKERSVIACMENYAYPKEDTEKARTTKEDNPEHDKIYSHGADTVRMHETYFHAVERLDGV